VAFLQTDGLARRRSPPSGDTGPLRRVAQPECTITAPPINLLCIVATRYSPKTGTAGMRDESWKQGDRGSNFNPFF
jgi:hypothetical protein